MSTEHSAPEGAERDLATEEIRVVRDMLAAMKELRAVAEVMAEDMLDQYRASDWEEAKDVIEGLNTVRMARVALEAMFRRAALKQD